jgi:hypothetical protein
LLKVVLDETKCALKRENTCNFRTTGTTISGED